MVTIGDQVTLKELLSGEPEPDRWIAEQPRLKRGMWIATLRHNRDGKTLVAESRSMEQAQKDVAGLIDEGEEIDVTWQVSGTIWA